MDAIWAKVRAFLNRMAGPLRAGQADADFGAELEVHIDLHIEDGIRSGLSHEEARRRALMRLGGAEQTRQALRERRGFPRLESLMRDLRYAMRHLAKHPAVTAIAVVSIGLGIGANTTIFSIVNRLVLRPAPVGDPSTLLSISTTHKGDRCCNHFPMPVYEDVRDHARSFSDMAAYAN